MVKKLLLCVLSSVLGLTWVILIAVPQTEYNNIFLFFLGNYLWFLPWFLGAMILVNFLMLMSIRIAQLVNRLMSLAIPIIVALLVLCIVSWNYSFDELLIGSFLTFTFSFLFSLIVYNRLIKKLNI